MHVPDGRLARRGDRLGDYPQRKPGRLHRLTAVHDVSTRSSSSGGASPSALYSVASVVDSPARSTAGRSGGIVGMGCRRGPDHKAGGASTARAMA